MDDAVTTATNRNKHAAILEGSASLQWTSWRTASRAAYEGVPLNNVGKSSVGIRRDDIAIVSGAVAGHAARRGDRYLDDRDGGAEEGHQTEPRREEPRTYQGRHEFCTPFPDRSCQGPFGVSVHDREEWQLVT